jgi:hypothetical protein
MRKSFVILTAIVLLLIGAVYVFIPNIINLKSSVTVNAARSGLHRALLDKEHLKKWWPGNISNDSFYLNELSYSINNSNITVLPIAINGSSTQLSSSLFLIETSKENTQTEWVAAMISSYNPFKRLQAYLKAKKINKDMDMILQKMQSYCSLPENIYGFDIKKALVKDSILIQTSGISKGYPSTAFIYSLIDKLKKYSNNNDAAITGYPMLNIRPLDSIKFEVKLALPIDSVLPGQGDILQKRMLGMGNILVTEVKGGNATAARAFLQIQKYALDYQRVAPAIPFYSLVTDRMQQPDSSKWITKIYFPVM